jgi:hypothetical protein
MAQQAREMGSKDADDGDERGVECESGSLSERDFLDGTDQVLCRIQLRSPSSWDQIRAEVTYLLSFAPNPLGDSIIKGLVKFVDDFVRMITCRSSPQKMSS